MQASQGNSLAFDLLVIKYQQKIINAVRIYINDPHEAQDVAQDTFVKAYQALSGFRGESEFYTWLYRIAMNTAKSYLSKSIKRPAVVGYDIYETEQYDTSGSLKGDGPEAEMIQEDLRKGIFSAISELSEDLRVAISLRELEGFSYKEIAEITGCPIGTVRSRIFRAREMINEAIHYLLD